MLLRDVQSKGGRLSGTGGAPDVARYEIEGLIEWGGFGAVYLARRGRDRHRVALKIMLSNVAVDERVRARFLQEIDVMKGLQHDNIVPLLDHGAAGSIFYFVMEYCDGGSVAHLMARRGGKLPVAEAAAIMLQALSGGVRP